jgi:hypothetical protein
MNEIILPHRLATDIVGVCADVRAGRGALVVVDERVPVFLLLAGPKGLPGWSLFCTSPVPHIELRTLDGRTLAEAAANRAFPAGLDQIVAKAEPLLGDDAAPALRALLAAVRATTETMRFRVPVVAEYVVEEGEPSFGAWASCLPLGVLQQCLDRSRRKAA